MPSTTDAARAHGFAATAAVLAGGGALLAGLSVLQGTYSHLLAAISLLTSLGAARLAVAGRGARARDLAGFTLWLMAGAAFAHATHPGVAVGTALQGILAVVPTALLLVLAIRATLPVTEPVRPRVPTA